MAAAAHEPNQLPTIVQRRFRLTSARRNPPFVPDLLSGPLDVWLLKLQLLPPVRAGHESKEATQSVVITFQKRLLAVVYSIANKRVTPVMNQNVSRRALEGRPERKRGIETGKIYLPPC